MDVLEGLEDEPLGSHSIDKLACYPAVSLALPPYFGAFETPITLERFVLRLCLSTDIYDPISINRIFFRFIFRTTSNLGGCYV